MPDLPEAFVKCLCLQLGMEEAALRGVYDLPALRGVRLNPLKRPDRILPEGAGEAVPWCREGRYLASDSRCGNTVLHEAGAWYLQEPSAMLPASVLGAESGERILDLCAAPGGKSTQLACAMGGQGLLVSNEIVPRRAQILSRNMERLGIMNSLVVSAQPAQLATRWPGAFDAVLADAPCSGEGMFRRHPETRLAWSEEAVRGCSERQREILDAAARMVRAGGRLVYATCTLNQTENEENVDAFLRSHPDFELAPFDLPGASGPEGFLTCYPTGGMGEGQFVAAMVKKGDEPGRMELLRPERLDAEERQAMASVLPWRGEVRHFGRTLCALSDCPDVSGLRVYRMGLHLGEVRKKVFVPDHALAVSAQPPELPRIELDGAEAVRYLMGEALRTDRNLSGYVLPCFDGLALGFGKVSGGVMKNHYPKGLRRQAEADGAGRHA